MRRLLLATAASLIALSGAAQADPGNGKGRGWGGGNVPPGQAKKMDRSDHHRDHAYRERDRDRETNAYREGYEDGARDIARLFRPGERLPSGYTVIRDYRSYGLPYPGDGQRYVRYDNDVYKIAQQTAAVTAIIGALSSLN